MRLLFVVNDAAFFLSHRAAVAVAARAAGYDVAVASPPGPGVAGVRALGFDHHPVALRRGGLTPLGDLAALWALWRLMRRLRPDLVHLVTSKPVIWGGLAARLARVPGRVAAISGLGAVFIGGSGPLRALVRGLYHLGMGGRGRLVIYQNADDAAALGLGPARFIRGSGVDLQAIVPRPEPPGVPVALMPARLLADKGLPEFVQAARTLRARGVALACVSIGDPDPANPASVPPDRLAAWAAEGAVTFRGHRTDIAAELAACHIVVLPSHREGLPKALVEAAAAGRPVVTTDAPGCRDAVEPGVSGLLVPVGDAAALADALARLAGDPALRARMGAAGRALAERAFDLNAVVAAHLRIYAELMPPPGPRPRPAPATAPAAPRAADGAAHR